MSTSNEIQVRHDGHVAHIVLSRPPHNHVDPPLMQKLADALLDLDGDDVIFEKE